MAPANRNGQALNGVYHYPPELLELVTDTIPALVRSKQAVIDFFAGAGVSDAVLSLWRARLRSDRDSVKKHEIARGVLRKLNELGDAALTARREVIKRISEYEDFSTCWDNERLKAQGLVARVRHVVNVKDSFTQMNIERERERLRRQSANRSAAGEVEEQRSERQQIKSDLYALFAITEAQKRGKALEGVLNRLFKHYGMLVREAFTVKGTAGEGIVEQIDGAIEIQGFLYLVEMKWRNEPVGRDHISPHLVSVFSRGDVRGLFISYSGFTEPAISDVKTALTQKVVVLMELEEITQALEGDADLQELLVKKIRRVQTHREPLHRPGA